MCFIIILIWFFLIFKYICLYMFYILEWKFDLDLWFLGGCCMFIYLYCFGRVEDGIIISFNYFCYRYFDIFLYFFLYFKCVLFFLVVDYCVLENYGCEYECVNVESFYLCRCYEGFVFNSDKKICLSKLYVYVYSVLLWWVLWT